MYTPGSTHIEHAHARERAHTHTDSKRHRNLDTRMHTRIHMHNDTQVLIASARIFTKIVRVYTRIKAYRRVYTRIGACLDTVATGSRVRISRNVLPVANHCTP